MTFDEAIKSGVPENVVAWNWLRQFAEHITAADDPVAQMKTIRTALEKQIPMKPVLSDEKHYGIEGTEWYECPSCKHAVGRHTGGDGVIKYSDFCPKCGQAIEWRDME